MQEKPKDPSAENAILLELTAEIISAYLGNNQVQAADIPAIMRDVHDAFRTIASTSGDRFRARREPAVDPKKSITRNYIVCLEDGRKFKSLKRHLKTHFDLTPDQYREKWGLAPNYPMVAPSYSEHRSRLAREKGLGRTSRPRARK